jgi:chorismate mutase
MVEGSLVQNIRFSFNTGINKEHTYVYHIWLMNRVDM